MSRESLNNIGLVHKDCAPKPIGAEPGYVKAGDYVKRSFTGGEHVEHMWVQVSRACVHRVYGVLANDPVYPENGREGDNVVVEYGQIEQILSPR